MQEWTCCQVRPDHQVILNAPSNISKYTKVVLILIITFSYPRMLRASSNPQMHFQLSPFSLIFNIWYMPSSISKCTMKITKVDLTMFFPLSCQVFPNVLELFTRSYLTMVLLDTLFSYVVFSSSLQIPCLITDKLCWLVDDYIKS